VKLGIHSFALIVTLTMLFAFFGTPPARGQTPAQCCSISVINESTGVVTAVVNSSGQTFRFKLSSPQPTASLYVGEIVYANFITGQVSFDGKSMVGSILTPLAPAAPTIAKAEDARIAEHPEDVPITVETLRPALAQVIAAAKDDFQSLIGKPADEKSDTLRVGLTFHDLKLSAFPEVLLPGLACRMMYHEPDKQWQTNTWSVVCVQEHGNLDEKMTSDYTNLVETVKQATGLPGDEFGVGSSVETRPGSHDLQKPRYTVFVEGGDGGGDRSSRIMNQVHNPTLPYIRVGLDGSFDGWYVTLQVGNHYPH
jgi:hypothetical protein